ncbi:UbiX family flavin prenyltransferase [Helicobacter sp. 23-1045]
MQNKQKFVVGITGASGIRLGIRFAGHLARFAKNSEIFVIFSNGAKMVAQYEEKIAKNALDSAIFQGISQNLTILNDSDLDSPVSSGSFGVSATLIIPCSANTLAKIACGISETLITRAALVALKERKTLLLAPREVPLNAIMLQNMLILSQMGAIIAPPMLSYYAGSENLAEMEDFVCGKWLDSIGVTHNLFPRWGESSVDICESTPKSRKSTKSKKGQ